jgi:hypothetical protein
MPHCNNCDGFLTENYVRVFAPSELETVPTCLNCTDRHTRRRHRPEAIAGDTERR